MKKVLLGTSALVLSTGFAWAEVEVSGDGRMGIIGGGNDDAATVDIDESDLTFTSRVRFSFTGSGETDGGVTFGGSLASDDSGDDGTSGSVFVEGAFGKLSMGDVDGAAKAAVGHVSGVGLTGLGDLNESTYLANVGPETPGALYENSFGDFTFYASADRPNVSDDEAYALGMSYGFGNYTFALGYENVEVGGVDSDHIIGGLTAAFGDATVKVIYGNADLGGADFDQASISLDYVFGMTTVTAFYQNVDLEGVGDGDAYGIGASYDLGGGASLKGGIADADGLDDPVFDFGISMTF